MSEIQSLPTLPAGGHERHVEKTPSYDELDEKKSPSYEPQTGNTLIGDSAYAKAGELQDEKLAEIAATQDVGDVFEDVRAIDLGADGKERPIEKDIDYAARLVSLDDDPTLPWNTFRMWLLGLGLACFGAVMGQLFYFRPQIITVSQLFLQIFGYFMGRFLERFIPGPSEIAVKRTADSWFWRFMNHGPFNIKEHVAVTIMASTASISAQGIQIFAAQELFYNIKPNPATAIFLLIGSQYLGYSLAGLLRSVLVHPTYALYPQIMPTVQLFDAMHRGKGVFLQKKRVRLFWILFCGIFVWEWFPEYIAPFLNGISIICLAAQNSAWVSRIFGGAANNEGLGLFSISLDWNYVGSGGGTIGSMFTPLHVQMAYYVGCAVCIIIFSVVYQQNVWKSRNFPFLSQQLFLENGTEYPQLAILNDDYSVNKTKLDAVGLPYFAGSWVIYKMSRTMYITAAVAHVLLWNAKDMWTAFRNQGAKQPDPHYQRMQVYKEVPALWYAGIFVITFPICIGVTYAAKAGLPGWATLVAIIFAAFFTPFIGVLYALYGYNPNVSNFMQLVGGMLVPGKPVANMYFTNFGFNSVVQAIGLLQDLKLGQYCKLPPRATFTVQCVGTLVGALINYIIMQSVIDGNRAVLLDTQGTNTWSGQNVQGFNSGAISLGALSAYLYRPSDLYGFVPLSMIAGLGLPVIFYAVHRIFPRLGADRVFTPILVAEIALLAGGINSAIFSSFILMIISQFWLRKKHPRFFRKYNFLISAALDGGTQVMIFVYSFAVGGASGTARPMPNWVFNPAGNPDYCKRLQS